MVKPRSKKKIGISVGVLFLLPALEFSPSMEISRWESKSRRTMLCWEMPRSAPPLWPGPGNMHSFEPSTLWVTQRNISDRRLADVVSLNQKLLVGFKDIDGQLTLGRSWPFRAPPDHSHCSTLDAAPSYRRPSATPRRPVVIPAGGMAAYMRVENLLIDRATVNDGLDLPTQSLTAQRERRQNGYHDATGAGHWRNS